MADYEVVVSKHKRILKGISPRTWEHPADKAALTALRQIPLLNDVMQKLLGFLNDKFIRLMALSSAVRVTPNQYPALYRMHREACMILDSDFIPELYVAQNPMLNAGAIGVEKPIILLNSALVDKLAGDEVQYIIGHELGHCLSGHALYKTILALFLRLSSLFFNIPAIELALMALTTALMEWDRKSEVSADRAGLLVVQKPEVGYNVNMKLAGGTDISQMDINEFFKQAAEYDKGGDLVDSVYKLMGLIGQTHPFPVIRLTELKGWVDSGAYGKVLGGEYIRKGSEEDSDDFGSHFKEAGEKYKEDLKKSEDPLSGMVHNVIDNVNNTAEQIGKFFEDFFKFGK